MTVFGPTHIDVYGAVVVGDGIAVAVDDRRWAVCYREVALGLGLL
jgi:hypothetical protein